MLIQNKYTNYNLYNRQMPAVRQSFGAAKDVNLKYINRVHYDILPKRIQSAVKELVQAGKYDSTTLYDLHKEKYAPLLDCKTLDEARNEFLEFRDVLDASVVVKRPKTVNIRKMRESVELEDLSLYLLKERWGKLKSLDEIAKDFGLSSRTQITWFMDKLQIPTFPKNYTTLLRSSDEALNEVIASKTRAYNSTRYDAVVEKNRRLSAENIELNRYISQAAWDRLPHIKETLSEISRTVPKENRFGVLWSRYPEYAKEFAEMKSQIAAELRGSVKRSKRKM